jgi:uncharacterized membrane protein
MDSLKRLVPVIGLLVLLLPARLPAQEPESVVHAVLFYHPTCPHCHQVITQYLIPLQDEYGRRLVILGMDTSQQWANNLYWEAIRHYEVPEEDWAVPMMVVGDEVLVGGSRIPSGFDPILEAGLAGDGVDLPNYPSLVTFLREQDALDPRYPDRLIARQAPPAEEEQPQEQEDSTGVEETPVERDPGERDPGEIADTTAVDTGAAREQAGEQTGEQAEEQELEEAPEVMAGDTASGDPETAVAPEDPGSDEDPEPPGSPEVEQAADSAAQAGVESGEEAGRTTVPPPDRDAASEEAPEGVGAMGLAEAARELESMTMWNRFNMDPAGNSLSVLVLAVMLVSLALRGYPPRVEAKAWPVWVIPALVLVGAGVAGYLSYIEVTHSEAVCGPVGDCNTVNQSAYATLFGFLPVGVLGLMGYGVILVLWVLRHSGSGELPRVATLGVWATALFGTLFSVYLTFLEPFVIGATCAWCLTSAVIMTLLLWASSPLAAASWKPGHPAPEAG